MMYWDGSWSWWAWLVMSFSMVAFWGLVIWAVVALFRRFDRDRPQASDPEAILGERFAAGQIDEEEYRSRLEVLRGRGRTLAGTRG
jgi:putative membrane protein